MRSVECDQGLAGLRLRAPTGRNRKFRRHCDSGDVCPKKSTYRLPAPQPAQARVIQESKRFNIVCGGRRWGKTILGMDRLIEPALRGKPVAWFAPNYRLLADVWRQLQVTLAPVILRVSQDERRLELRGGGVIEMWSLDSPDAGRGRAYATVVIDEAAMVPNLDEAWQSIRPMLTDLRGDAWFLSTPKGMNSFKTLYDRGQDPERAEWRSWQMPASENPYIQAEEMDSARRDMTEAAFNQEYLALFVNWEGSVIRRVGEAATATAKMQREAGHDAIGAARTITRSLWCSTQPLGQWWPWTAPTEWITRCNASA